MPPPTNICKTCKWWEKFQTTASGDCGYCHRYAPVRNGIIQISPYDHKPYPIVHEDEWCGDWQIKTPA